MLSSLWRRHERSQDPRRKRRLLPGCDYLADVYPDPADDAPLFLGRKLGGTRTPGVSALDWGKPWEWDAYAKRVFRLAVAGLNPKIRLHYLRHFSCSNSVEAGQSVDRVAQRHGHADPAFTSRGTSTRSMSPPPPTWPLSM